MLISQLPSLPGPPDFLFNRCFAHLLITVFCHAASFLQSSSLAFGEDFELHFAQELIVLYDFFPFEAFFSVDFAIPDLR